MTRMTEKLRGLVASNPRDQAARSIYADALIQEDDPRGHYIMLETLLLGRTSPNKREDAARQSKLLFHTHEQKWLAPIEGWAEVRWRGGFIHAIRAKAKDFVERGPALVALEPVAQVTLTNTSDVDAKALADCPAIAKLDLLRLQGTLTDKGAAAIAASKHATEITRLLVAASSLGTGFAEALANMRGLRSLTLTGVGIGDDPLSALGASVPRLERLFLARNEISDDGVTALVEGDHLPELRVLCLGGNTELGDGAAEALASSALTKLEELELNQTGLTDEGAGAIIKSKKLKALKRLDVRQTEASPKGRKGLNVIT